MIHSLYNFYKSKANHSTLFEFVTMEWGCRLGIIHAHTEIIGLLLAFHQMVHVPFFDNHASKICLQLNRVSFLASKKYPMGCR